MYILLGTFMRVSWSSFVHRGSHCPSFLFALLKEIKFLKQQVSLKFLFFEWQKLEHLILKIQIYSAWKTTNTKQSSKKGKLVLTIIIVKDLILFQKVWQSFSFRECGLQKISLCSIIRLCFHTFHISLIKK